MIYLDSPSLNPTNLYPLESKTYCPGCGRQFKFSVIYDDYKKTYHFDFFGNNLVCQYCGSDVPKIQICK